MNTAAPSSPSVAESGVAIVYGALRAGTTMLRLMLDGHPRLSCIGETDYLVDHLIPAPGGWKLDRSALEESRIFRASGLSLPEGDDGRTISHALVDQIRQRHGKRPVLMMHRRMAQCAALYPDATIIHYTRDPRDVARSAIAMGWAGNVYHGCDSWLETESGWQRFIRETPDARYLHLRYEDLVARPEAELARLCDFLGLPYDPEMLTYPARTTYDAPDPSLGFQWRRKLSGREVALVESRVGGLLAAAGYAPSGERPAPPGRVVLLVLKFQNRASIWRRMIHRYGLVDPVLRGLGRRLGIEALRRPAARRMDEKTIKYLK